MKIVALILLGVVGLVALSASSEAFRREAGERARDLSDRLMMLFLRSTSGFAADVPSRVGEEERERRLRWRAPSTSTGGSPISR
jgi:hypothetical protein